MVAEDSKQICKILTAEAHINHIKEILSSNYRLEFEKECNNNFLECLRGYAKSWDREFTLLFFNQIDSTMTVGKVLEPLIIDNNKRIFLIFADNQTAGTGRSGTTWKSVEESIACTICFSYTSSNVLNLSAALLQLIWPTYIFFSSDSNKEVFGDNLSIKWPNDIVDKITMTKYCGVLCQSSYYNPKQIVYRMGIGVNIKSDKEYQGLAQLLPENSRSPTSSILKEDLQSLIINKSAGLIKKMCSEDPCIINDFIEEQLFNYFINSDLKDGQIKICPTLFTACEINSTVTDQFLYCSVKQIDLNGNIVLLDEKTSQEYIINSTHASYDSKTRTLKLKH